MASTVVGLSYGLAGGIGFILGGIVSTVNSRITAETDDLDKFAAAAKVYITQILDNTSTALEETLPGFFGADDKLSKIEDLYNLLVKDGLMPSSLRVSTVSKV